MNGPRMLSNDHLSYLVISTPVSSSERDSTSDIEYDLLMCAPHFIGDGTALHQTTHDLICMLTSDKTNDELKTELDEHHDWVCNRSSVSCMGKVDLRVRKPFYPHHSKLNYPRPAPPSERQLQRLTFCRLLAKRLCVFICPLFDISFRHAS